MHQEIKPRILPFLIDVLFWLGFTAVIGLALYFYTGGRPVYFWLMLACGLFAGLRNLVICLLLAIDLGTHSPKTANLAVIGKRPYWLNGRIIKLANQEKPFYYTLFSREPIVPYPFDFRQTDGSKIGLILSVPRSLLADRPLAAGALFRVEYLKRSGIILMITAWSAEPQG
jgi:hypothetical protein